MLSFAVFFRVFVADISAVLGETNDLEHKSRYVGCIALYLLHFQLFRIVDKKLIRSMWDVYKKVKPTKFYKHFYRVRKQDKISAHIKFVL